jgi:PleD family two-component response regulator
MSEEKQKNKEAKAKAIPPKLASGKDGEIDDDLPDLDGPELDEEEDTPPPVKPTKPKAEKKASPMDDDDDAPFLTLDDDEDSLPLDASLAVADTSERTLLVVDEEGQRRNETVTIIQQILPNATIEVADDPEEAMDMMFECEFDTYVVNFLMPGFSNSKFVKAVANHPDHPLLVGFAADKMSDALDPKKGLKIIPLKRLFDLSGASAADGEGEGED